MKKKDRSTTNGVKYMIIAGLFLSVIMASSFFVFNIAVFSAQMGHPYPGFVETGIQLPESGDGVGFNFVIIVPISLFISWLGYFRKRYDIALLFAYMPLFYTGYLICSIFPISDFGKILLYMLTPIILVQGIMAGVVYWVIPISLLALLVKYFSSRS